MGRMNSWSPPSSSSRRPLGRRRPRAKTVPVWLFLGSCTAGPAASSFLHHQHHIHHIQPSSRNRACQSAPTPWHQQLLQHPASFLSCSGPLVVRPGSGQSKRRDSVVVTRGTESPLYDDYNDDYNDDDDDDDDERDEEKEDKLRDESIRGRRSATKSAPFRHPPKRTGEAAESSAPFPSTSFSRTTPIHPPSSPSSTTTAPPPLSMNVALALIPPDEAWDRLQRARHVARDPSFTQWPPAIRLFHPFYPLATSATSTTTITYTTTINEEEEDVALRLASWVEKHEIQPLTLSFTRWSVLPHAEAMEADWEAWRYQQQQQLARQNSPRSPDASSFSESAASSSSSSAFVYQSEEDFRVDQLIAREERIGREKLAERKRREQQRKESPAVADESAATAHNPVAPPPRRRLGRPRKNSTVTSSTVPARNRNTLVAEDPGHYPEYRDDQMDPDGESSSNGRSMRALWEKQQRMYEEFNGPCIVCLEPDDESQAQLQQLRQLLVQDLFPELEKCYSVSSSLSNAMMTDPQLPKAVLESETPFVYRPVIPVAAFSTVTQAVEMARKLRKAWTHPLTFNITDLQIISTLSSSSSSSSSSLLSSPASTREYDPRSRVPMDDMRRPEERYLSDNKGGQFGCDAMIMLMGEEIAMDEQINQGITQLLCERGEMGGYYINNQENNNDAEKDGNQIEASDMDIGPELAEDDLELWLDHDDDFDEGTVVVIGRTHFFSGEMRSFVGMPATSVMDGKDRMLGDQVSGAARRRGVVHRSADLYNEGDWGRKPEDLSPWSKFSKKKSLI